MARRIDYGRIAVILSVIILVIFAYDFIRRAYDNWRGENGQLIVETSGLDSYATTPNGTTGGSDLPSDGTTGTTTTTEGSENLPKLTLLASEVHTGSLVLVDDSHSWSGSHALAAFSELDYAHFRLPSRSLQIARSMSQDLIAMFKDFYGATGLGDVMIYATTNTPAALAYQVSIPERVTGLTIDLAVWDESTQTHSPFTGEGQYAWLQTHCAEYGFVQRYSADKADITGMTEHIWHYRYVGIPHAIYMTEQSLCLEEYLKLLRDSHDADNPLTVTTASASYTVYYVPKAEDGGMLEITVPKDVPITVSGDNMGGYIITIENAA